MYNWGSALFIWLFLIIAQPFGISDNNVSLWILVIYVLPFALLWCGISYLIDAFGNWLRFLSIKQNLILWLFKIIVFAHALTIIRASLCVDCIDLNEYAQMWLASIILFVLTYIPFMLYSRSSYFHQLVGKPRVDDFVIRGEGKEQLLVSLDSIYYIQADDNYVDIYLRSNLIGKKTLRATLSSIEIQMKIFPQFVRIHRSTIVNMNYAVNLSKRGQILVKDKEYQINLSIGRKYQDSLDELFIHPK